jgi:hypothetical protein
MEIVMNLTRKQELLLKTLHVSGHNHTSNMFCAAKCDPCTLGVLIQIGLVCALDGGIHLSDSGKNVAKKFNVKNEDD